MMTDSRRETGQGRTAVETQVSAVGSLPDAVGLVLVVVVSAGLVGLGRTLGYPASLLLALCLLGTTVALGLRTATREKTTHVVAGVTLLWTSALASVAVTGLLVGQHATSTQTIVTALVVSGATLLGPFAIISSTLPTEHRTGQDVLRRYVLGTVVLLGFVVLAGITALVRDVGWSLVTALLPALGSESDSLVQRAVVALAVYAIFLWLVGKASRSLPAAVFVSPAEFDRIETVQSSVERVSRWGKRVLAGYGLLVLAAVLVRVGTTTDTSIEALVRLLVRAGSIAVLVWAVALGIWLLALALGCVFVLRWVGSLTPDALAESVVPPAIIFVLVGVPSLLVGEQGINALADAHLEVTGAPLPLYGVLTSWPSVAPLVVCSIALLCCAAVLSIPAGLSGTGPNDESLAGITASVLALATVVVIAVVADASFAGIALGVTLAAIVWEFGEYATVASGELGAQTPDSLPNGLSTLATIHALVTVLVALAGLAVASVFVVVATPSVPVTVAVLAAIVSTLGLAALLFVLR